MDLTLLVSVTLAFVGGMLVGLWLRKVEQRHLRRFLRAMREEE